MTLVQVILKLSTFINCEAEFFRTVRINIIDRKTFEVFIAHLINKPKHINVAHLKTLLNDLLLNPHLNNISQVEHLNYVLSMDESGVDKKARLVSSTGKQRNTHQKPTAKL